MNPYAEYAQELAAVAIEHEERLQKSDKAPSSTSLTIAAQYLVRACVGLLYHLAGNPDYNLEQVRRVILNAVVASVSALNEMQARQDIRRDLDALDLDGVDWSRAGKA